MDPPVPIPNTEVTRPSADDTALVTEWENRPLPGMYYKEMGFLWNPTASTKQWVMP